MDFFCEQLNNTLTFFPDRIMACCTLVNGPIYIPKYQGTDINFEIIKAKKRKYFEDINNEMFPCKNCFHLKEKTDDDLFSEKYREINISSFTHCNCRCIYCVREKKKGDYVKFSKKRSSYYDMLPIVKDLYLNNLLDTENLIVRFQGGEIGVLKEFEDLVRTFDKNGVMSFHFLSNNIVYQPIIAEMMKKNKASLCTSLDCGTRETYKKIKRVDKFNAVINNLNKYKKECGEKTKIIVKYIVVIGYNDNEKEVISFLDLMKKLKIPGVKFEIDYRYLNSNSAGKVVIPKHFYKLLSLFEEYTNKNNIDFEIDEQIKIIMRNGEYSQQDGLR